VGGGPPPAGAGARPPPPDAVLARRIGGQHGKAAAARERGHVDDVARPARDHPAHRLLRAVDDGAEVEVLSETEDGEWIMVRYLYGENDPLFAGTEDLAYRDEVEVLLGVARKSTWSDKVTVIDDGRHVRLIANGVDLAGGSWIPLSSREGSPWAGIYSGTNDQSLINEFVVWPATVHLTDAFDALRSAPDADQFLGSDSFNAPNGTDLDQRPLDSDGLAHLPLLLLAGFTRQYGGRRTPPGPG
jgi:hypothetical protein